MKTCIFCNRSMRNLGGHISHCKMNLQKINSKMYYLKYILNLWENNKEYRDKNIKHLLSIPRNRFKSGYFFSKKADKKLYYKSSYELKVIENLENDDNVTSFHYESFGIMYDKRRYYYPDFLIEYKNNFKELVEVKPLSIINQKLEIDILKFKAAEKYCLERNIKFSIWTEEKIFFVEN